MDCTRLLQQQWLDASWCVMPVAGGIVVIWWQQAGSISSGASVYMVVEWAGGQTGLRCCLTERMGRIVHDVLQILPPLLPQFNEFIQVYDLSWTNAASPACKLPYYWCQTSVVFFSPMHPCPPKCRWVFSRLALSSCQSPAQGLSQTLYYVVHKCSILLVGWWSATAGVYKYLWGGGHAHPWPPLGFIPDLVGPNLCTSQDEHAL